ncbi:MAG: hypothetical protein OXH83_06325 [Bryobacterales bacterium]|nr:hypothetical protein [Bryobacterales bacterium]
MTEVSTYTVGFTIASFQPSATVPSSPVLGTYRKDFSNSSGAIGQVQDGFWI